MFLLKYMDIRTSAGSYIYLRQGGYVFAGVYPSACLLVSKISGKAVVLWFSIIVIQGSILVGLGSVLKELSTVPGAAAE